MKSIIYIIDARHRINNFEIETIFRHKKYASNLEKISRGMCQKIVIIQTRKKSELQSETLSPELDVIRVDGKFGMLSLNRIIQTMDLMASSESVIFVAGDPFISGFLAIRLRDWFKNNLRLVSKVQVQIHFELNAISSKVNPKSIFKYFLTKFSLRNADQLRFVDNGQRDSFREKFGFNKPTVVIPVPLNISTYYKITEKVSHPNSIAFVGRLHKERGLTDFIHIAETISAFIPDLDVLIYGDGPEKNNLEKIIGSKSLRGKYIFKGNFPNLDSEWPHIGILVSSAPTESYGRAIREALIHGVPVLAVTSLGSTNLHSLAPVGSIEVLPPTFGESKIKDAYQTLQNYEIPMHYRQHLMNEQLQLVTQIPAAWVDLMGMK